MKQSIIVAAVLCSVLGLACSEDTTFNQPRTSLQSGTVVVFVHWDQQGLVDKRVEVVELGIELMTDDRGLAEFVVPIGDYTVRVYDINRGGPPMFFVDEKVTVAPKDETRVEVIDCLPCV